MQTKGDLPFTNPKALLWIFLPGKINSFLWGGNSEMGFYFWDYMAPKNIAMILMAAKFGIPVCPHAGGVGLCEMVQHLAMFDFVAVGGENPDRVVEFVDPPVTGGSERRFYRIRY